MTTSSKAAQFRALHAAGCFVIPNPWDIGSAVYLAHLGFQALATTSGGLAFSLGRADERLDCASALENMHAIASAVAVPVSADFQSGYADEADALAANVSRCAASGVAGLSIEDASGDPSAPLFERARAIARIATARRAIDAVDPDIVLTARCEAYLVGASDPLRVVLDRLVAYADAGADCLFAPGVLALDEIAAVVRAVAPKPVNVLVGSAVPGLSLHALGDLGVRRVSVGSGLARAAWSAFAHAAEGLARGSFDGLRGATPYAELNQLFGQPRRS